MKKRYYTAPTTQRAMRPKFRYVVGDDGYY